MLKKTIEFLDLDGNKIKDVFYFNLSKAELAEMELRNNGTFAEKLMRIVADKNGDAIMDTFQYLLKKSYGVRSEDGRRFIKTDQVWQEFFETDAYSELFMELVTNAQAATDFIRGIVPPQMQAQIDENEKANDLVQKTNSGMERLSGAIFGNENEGNAAVPEDKNPEPAWIRENRDPTPTELRKMTPEQLRDAYSKKLGKTD